MISTLIAGFLPAPLLRANSTPSLLNSGVLSVCVTPACLRSPTQQPAGHQELRGRAGHARGADPQGQGGCHAAAGGGGRGDEAQAGGGATQGARAAEQDAAA